MGILSCWLGPASPLNNWRATHCYGPGPRPYPGLLYLCAYIWIPIPNPFFPFTHAKLQFPLSTLWGFPFSWRPCVLPCLFWAYRRSHNLHQDDRHIWYREKETVSTYSHMLLPTRLTIFALELLDHHPYIHTLAQLDGFPSRSTRLYPWTISSMLDSLTSAKLSAAHIVVHFHKLSYICLYSIQAPLNDGILICSCKSSRRA